ncbi:hypothetical protein DEU56DRAFT_761978 [Suillus clintonianus]|uniref:uncharacterized protein n=1 Tax=Suillus clintonianus TaxID=1904413 RepID=UPI001B85E36C|nr:uncharacterized protein DEU56DRAFT_761978 [Suillus clintonianus]KAG2112884.1 hypothetical protein DEU56DRAFT_761978 [Suillus clintonianus]
MMVVGLRHSQAGFIAQRPMPDYIYPSPSLYYSTYSAEPRSRLLLERFKCGHILPHPDDDDLDDYVAYEILWDFCGDGGYRSSWWVIMGYAHSDGQKLAGLKGPDLKNWQGECTDNTMSDERIMMGPYIPQYKRFTEVGAASRQVMNVAGVRMSGICGRQDIVPNSCSNAGHEFVEKWLLSIRMGRRGALSKDARYKWAKYPRYSVQSDVKAHLGTRQEEAEEVGIKISIESEKVRAVQGKYLTGV